MFWREVLIRMLEILLIPYYHREILWTIAPLLFGLVMIQMYFGKYKTEQLGWNTAYGNTISFMWAIAILLKFLHESYGIGKVFSSPLLAPYILLVLVLAVLTVILAFVEYHHLIPPKMAFLISSAIPMNGLAYFVVIIVMGRIPIDTATFTASLILFTFFALVFGIYRSIITPSESARQTLKRHEEEKKKKVRKIKMRIKKALKPILPNH